MEEEFLPNTNVSTSRRLKPRKHAQLFQAFSFWRELSRMLMAHKARISAVERGACALDAEFEVAMIKRLNLEDAVEYARKSMIDAASEIAVWPWITQFNGLRAGGLAAQLLAQIDDIGKFRTVSALWRYAGYAVVDGKREYRRAGEPMHYNNTLKSTCYLIGQQFLRSQTEPWVSFYYDYKERIRNKYRSPWCEQCNRPASACTGKKHRHKYTDGHIHMMAMRAMIKIFLCNLWVRWREYEGLPVTPPYVQAVLGHTGVEYV